MTAAKLETPMTPDENQKHDTYIFAVSFIEEVSDSNTSSCPNGISFCPLRKVSNLRMVEYMFCVKKDSKFNL